MKANRLLNWREASAIVNTPAALLATWEMMPSTVSDYSRSLYLINNFVSGGLGLLYVIV